MNQQNQQYLIYSRQYIDGELLAAHIVNLYLVRLTSCVYSQVTAHICYI